MKAAWYERVLLSIILENHRARQWPSAVWNAHRRKEHPWRFYGH